MLAIIFICIAFIIGYVAGYDLGKTERNKK